MSRILVWDLPTRVLHWAFAGSLAAALVLGFGLDDEHPLFAYHMLFGLVAGLVLVARIVLGIVGSRHARFASWTWSSRPLAGYLRGVFTGTAPRYVAHNPASTWVSAAMFGLVALLIATGIMAGKGFEHTHEVLAAALIAAIALHLLGLVWHTARHRENIGRAMVDGRKMGPPEAALRSHHAWSGVFVAVGVLAWALALFRNYDPATARVRLPLLGTEVQLAESRHTEGKEHVKARAHPHD
jgi:cytochrome b